MQTVDLRNYLIKQLFTVRDEAMLRRIRKVLNCKSEETLLYYLCESQLGRAIKKRLKTKRREPSNAELFQEVESWL